MTENEISYKIRGAIFKVHNTLGPGLFESVYSCALEYELKQAGLSVVKEKPMTVFYNNIKLDVGFRLDLLVEEKVIVELKSVESLAKVHYKQVLTYLKVSNLKLGLLVNFNTLDILSDTKRVVNRL